MDMWAIGLVIIEILVGTDLTIPLVSLDDVEEMLDILEDIIDPATLRILKHLMIFESCIIAKDYIE